MVVLITSYNSIEIASIEDVSKEGLCDILNSKNIKPISTMNLDDDKLCSLCYLYDPEGAIKQKEKNEFATEFSNYNNIYGDIVICKKIGSQYFDFEDDELAEIILSLVTEAEFLQIGFLKENEEPELDSLYLSFGKYPQTLVTDKKLSNILDTIEDTNDEGYIVYKKKEFQKLTAIGSKTLYINGANFEIEKWKSYYFLVEPLQWDILYDNDDILLICDKIIDNYYFNKKKHNLVLDNQSINENDFYFSDVRKYLNRYFLNKAFTKKEIDKIVSTISDENVDEKVSLLSEEIIEYVTHINPEPTDYALCMGCELIDDEGHASWWLRSEGDNIDETATIGSEGYKINYVRSYAKKCGIRPVIHLKK